MAEEETKHTPGPWKVRENGHTVEVCSESDDANEIVSMPGWSEQYVGEEMANARLIAAAPDLLDALKTVLFAARDGAVLPRDSAHAQALAAISKATGK